MFDVFHFDRLAAVSDRENELVDSINLLLSAGSLSCPQTLLAHPQQSDCLLDIVLLNSLDIAQSGQSCGHTQDCQEGSRRGECGGVLVLLCPGLSPHLTVAVDNVVAELRGDKRDTLLARGNERPQKAHAEGCVLQCTVG